MSAYEWTIVAVAAVVIAGLVVLIVHHLSAGRLLEDRIRREAVVTLKGGAAFTGVLYEYDARVLILRNAESIGEVNAANAPVDGELLVLWADVAYVQLP